MGINSSPLPIHLVSAWLIFMKQISRVNMPYNNPMLFFEKIGFNSLMCDFLGRECLPQQNHSNIFGEIKN